MTMNRAKVGTVAVPTIDPTTNQDIGAFFTAPGVPTRLFIRNVGGTQIQLAFDSSAINGANATSSGDRHELPPGERVTFTLQPGQQVFAIGVGVGRLTWHSSDARYFEGTL